MKVHEPEPILVDDFRIVKANSTAIFRESRCRRRPSCISSAVVARYRCRPIMILSSVSPMARLTTTRDRCAGSGGLSLDPDRQSLAQLLPGSPSARQIVTDGDDLDERLLRLHPSIIYCISERYAKTTIGIHICFGNAQSPRAVHCSIESMGDSAGRRFVMQDGGLIGGQHRMVHLFQMICVIEP